MNQQHQLSYDFHGFISKLAKASMLILFIINIQCIFADDIDVGRPSGSVYYNLGPLEQGMGSISGKDKTLEFNIHIPQALSVEKAQLIIEAFDVDEEKLAIDHVYFNDHFLGHLSGLSQSHSETAFNIPTAIIKQGVNTVLIRGSVLGGDWRVNIRGAYLLVDGGDRSFSHLDDIQILDVMTIDKQVEISVAAHTSHQQNGLRKLACLIATGREELSNFNETVISLDPQLAQLQILRSVHNDLHMKFKENGQLDLLVFNPVVDRKEKLLNAFNYENTESTLNLSYPLTSSSSIFNIECYLYRITVDGNAILQNQTSYDFQHIKDEGPTKRLISNHHRQINVKERLTPIRLNTEPGSYIILEKPKQGELVSIEPNLVYQPKLMFNGHDDMRVQINNGEDDQAPIELDIVLNVDIDYLAPIKRYLLNQGEVSLTSDDYLGIGLTISDHYLPFINAVIKNKDIGYFNSAYDVHVIGNAVKIVVDFIESGYTSEIPSIDHYQSLGLFKLTEEIVPFFHQLLSTQSITSFEDLFHYYSAVTALLEVMHNSQWQGIDMSLFDSLGLPSPDPRVLSVIGGLIETGLFSITEIIRLINTVQSDEVFEDGKLIIASLSNQPESIVSDEEKNVKIHTLPKNGILLLDEVPVEEGDVINYNALIQGDLIYKPEYALHNLYDYIIFEWVDSDRKKITEHIYAIRIEKQPLVTGHTKKVNQMVNLGINGVAKSLFDREPNNPDLIDSAIQHIANQSENLPIKFQITPAVNHVEIVGKGLSKDTISVNNSKIKNFYISVTVDLMKKNHSGMVSFLQDDTLNLQVSYSWKGLSLNASIHDQYQVKPELFSGDYLQTELSISIFDDILLIKNPKNYFEAVYFSKYFSSRLSHAKLIALESKFNDGKQSNRNSFTIPDNADYILIKKYSGYKPNNELNEASVQGTIATYSNLYIDLQKKNVTGMVHDALEGKYIYGFDRYALLENGEQSVLENSLTLVENTDIANKNNLDSLILSIENGNQLVISSDKQVINPFNSIFMAEFYQRLYQSSSSVLLDADQSYHSWGEDDRTEKTDFKTKFKIPTDAKTAILTMHQIATDRLSNDSVYGHGYILLDLEKRKSSGIIYESHSQYPNFLSWNDKVLSDDRISKGLDNADISLNAVKSNHANINDFSTPWLPTLSIYVNASKELEVKSTIPDEYPYTSEMSAQWVSTINWFGVIPITINVESDSFGWRIMDEKKTLLTPEEIEVTIPFSQAKNVYFYPPFDFLGDIKLFFKSMDDRVEAYQNLVISTDDTQGKLISSEPYKISKKIAENKILNYLSNAGAPHPTRIIYQNAGMPLGESSAKDINAIIKNTGLRDIDSVQNTISALHSMMYFAKYPGFLPSPTLETYHIVGLNRVSESILAWLEIQVGLQKINTFQKLQETIDAILKVESYLSKPEISRLPSTDDFHLAGIPGVSKDIRGDIHFLSKALNIDTFEAIKTLTESLNTIYAYRDKNTDSPAFDDYKTIGYPISDKSLLHAVNSQIVYCPPKSFKEIKDTITTIQLFYDFVMGKRPYLTIADFNHLCVSLLNESELKNITTWIRKNQVITGKDITKILKSMRLFTAYLNGNALDEKPSIDDYRHLGIDSMAEENLDQVNELLLALSGKSLLTVTSTVDRYSHIFSRIKNKKAAYLRALDYRHLGIDVDAENLDMLNEALVYLQPNNIESIDSINAVIKKYHHYFLYDGNVPLNRKDYSILGISNDKEDLYLLLDDCLMAMKYKKFNDLILLFNALKKVLKQSYSHEDISLVSSVNYQRMGLEGVSVEAAKFINHRLSRISTLRLERLRALQELFLKIQIHENDGHLQIELSKNDFVNLGLENITDDYVSLLNKATAYLEGKDLIDVLSFIDALYALEEFRIGEADYPTGKIFNVLTGKTFTEKQIFFVNREIKNLEYSVTVERFNSIINALDEYDEVNVKDNSLDFIASYLLDVDISKSNAPIIKDIVKPKNSNTVSAKNIEIINSIVAQSVKNTLPQAFNDQVFMSADESTKVIDVVANDIDDGVLTVVGLDIIEGDAKVEIANNKIVVTPTETFDDTLLFTYQIRDEYNAFSQADVVLQRKTPLTPTIVIQDVDASNKIVEPSLSYFTPIKTGFAKAFDFMEIPLLVERINPERYFIPGNNFQYWKACDDEGRCVIKTQTITIDPQVYFQQDFSVEEGTDVVVFLNIESSQIKAIQKLNYIVTGDADSYDHDLPIEGELSFNFEKQKEIEFYVKKDAVKENDETITITLYNTSGDWLDEITITVTEENLPPVVDVKFAQNNQSRYIFSKFQGTINLLPKIYDPNSQDLLRVDWQVDPKLLPVFFESNQLATLEPENVEVGAYSLGVNAFDQMGLSHNMLKTLVIRSMLPVLDEDYDMDNDGFNNKQEGYRDSNDNGLPDYLDNSPNCHHLSYRVIQRGYKIITDKGSCLKLGKIAMNQNPMQGAVIEKDLLPLDDEIDSVGGIFDFVVTQLKPNGIADIVLPLMQVSPHNLLVRYYHPSSDWQSFGTQSNDEIYSALGHRGYCPGVTSPLWKQGISSGFWCLRLKLSDGGYADTDNKVNGSINAVLSIGIPKSDNKSPLASNDHVLLYGNSQQVVHVIENDLDLDGDHLEIIEASADIGEVIIDESKIALRYTPPLSFLGQDKIVYSIHDGKGGIDSAEVSLTLDVHNNQNIVLETVETMPSEEEQTISIRSGSSSLWHFLLLGLLLVLKQYYFRFAIGLVLFGKIAIGQAHDLKEVALLEPQQNFSFSWQVGWVANIHKKSHFNKQLNEQDLGLRIEAMDGYRFMSHWSAGYFMNKNWFIDGGLWWMPGMEMKLTGDIRNTPKTVEKLKSILPGANGGYSLSSGYRFLLNNSWAIDAKAGMYYLSASKTTIIFDNNERMKLQKAEAFGFIYGLSAYYAIDKNWQAGLQWHGIHVDDVLLLQLGLSISFRLPIGCDCHALK